MSSRSFLSQDKCFRLWNYLSSQKDRLLRDRPHDDEVAKQATESIGFPVSECNIRAAKKVCGVTWRVKRADNGGRGGRRGSQKVSRIFARELVRIAENLGMTPNADVVTIAKGITLVPESNGVAH